MSDFLRKQLLSYLSLAVDTKNSASWFVLSGNENSLTRDAIHVYAGASLNIIQMDISILGDQINNPVFRHSL